MATTRKAKLVLHHDDPPCETRLDKDGDCPECRYHPETQSTALYPYCPTCQVPLRNMTCVICKETYEKPG